MSFELRQYQQDIVNKLRRGLAEGHRCQIVALPTGGGKTCVAGEIARLATERGRHTLFVVDRVVLVKQTVEKFLAHGLKCSVLQADNTELHQDADCTVATIHTLQSRLKLHPHLIDAALVIYDECHIIYKKHRELIDRWGALPFIGLSATPLREGLGQIYTNLIRGPSIQQMISDEYLVTPKCFGPSEPDLKNINIVATQFGMDFSSSQLAREMKTLVGDAVASWKRLSECRRTIVFACNLAHARDLVDAFNHDGIRAMGVTHRTPEDEREIMYKGLCDGTIPVLVSVNVLGLGFDEPSVGCVVLARPTMSRALHIQQIGRGLRTSANKTNCIVIDHAGNIARHGMPQNFVVPDLDDGDGTGKKVQRIKEKQAYSCTSCGYLLELNQWECPNCFHSRRRNAEVSVVDGSIVDLDTGELALEPISKKQFWRELVWLVESDNQKWTRKRALAIFKGRYDEWPDRAWEHLAGIEPSSETTGWLRHNQISYVKSKSRKAAMPIRDVLPIWDDSMRGHVPGCKHQRFGMYQGGSHHLAQKRCSECGKHLKWVGADELLRLVKQDRRKSA